MWQNAIFDWGAFSRPDSLISSHRSPAGHYAVAQRCEKIWWLGPRRCRAGSKLEATKANKSPFRYHAAAIEIRVKRVGRTRGVRVCSGAGAKAAWTTALAPILVPAFGKSFKPCVTKGGSLFRCITYHHGVGFRGIPVDTCKYSSE